MCQSQPGIPAQRGRICDSWQWTRDLPAAERRNYTLDSELFARRAAIHREAVPEGFPIMQGIGIASGTGTMTSAAELAVQIMAARRVGAAGFIGFAYQPGHTTDLFTPLGFLRR